MQIVVVNQISESLISGQLSSLGFHIHYGGQEAAVQFLTVADISRPLQHDAVQAKLRLLGEACLEAAQSPEGISIHLPR